MAETTDTDMTQRDKLTTKTKIPQDGHKNDDDSQPGQDRGITVGTQKNIYQQGEKTHHTTKKKII